MTTYDSNFHPKDLIRLMALGNLDCEIFAEWDIAKSTFYKWRQDHEEFDQAFQKGLPKCEAWWTNEMRKCFLSKDDKGFKYCIAIMNNKFGWERGAKIEGNTTNIHINNMAVLQNKSRDGLLDFIKAKIEQHKDIVNLDFNTLKTTTEEIKVLDASENTHAKD